MQTKEKDDFANVPLVSFLAWDFVVSENNFSQLSDNSIVILDDYQLKNPKCEFLNVINYYLRHHKITLFLLIHNLYNIGLMNEILNSPTLILAYSTLGYTIIK